MSIDTKAVLLVGCPRSELPEDFDPDENAMDTYTPYYDGSKDAVVGFTVEETGNHNYLAIELDTVTINLLKKAFAGLTGVEPKLYLTPDIS